MNKKRKTDYFDFGKPFDISGIKIGSPEKPKKNQEKNKRPPDYQHLKEKFAKRYWKGSLEGRCFCCGDPLSFGNAEIGHIKASSKGGDWSDANCRLICSRCNRGMGSTNMKVYMKRVYRDRYDKQFSKDKPETKKPIKKSPVAKTKKPIKKKPKNPFDITKIL